MEPRNRNVVPINELNHLQTWLIRSIPASSEAEECATQDSKTEQETPSQNSTEELLIQISEEDNGIPQNNSFDQLANLNFNNGNNNNSIINSNDSQNGSNISGSDWWSSLAWTTPPTQAEHNLITLNPAESANRAQQLRNLERHLLD